MILGLIPARGGSKGVPRKNIRMLSGRPLLAYAIECASQVGELDEWFVSTDDSEIAEIAKKWGAPVPFLRDSSLAGDTTPMMDVVLDALHFAEKRSGKSVEAVVLLDPTAPFRLPEDVSKALALFREKKGDAVISGNRAHRNPYFNMVKKSASGEVELVCAGTNAGIARRQDAPEVFDLNTVVWIWSRSAVMSKTRIPPKTFLLEIPSERTIDIDTPLDFEIAEYRMKKRVQEPQLWQ